jgi:hypothetical protein
LHFCRPELRAGATASGSCNAETTKTISLGLSSIHWLVVDIKMQKQSVLKCTADDCRYSKQLMQQSAGSIQDSGSNVMLLVKGIACKSG